MAGKIWIVSGSSGEYSDRTDWNICAVLTEERAKSIMEKLILLRDFNKEFAVRIYNEFEVPYRATNDDEMTYRGYNQPAVSPEFRAAMEKCAHGMGTPQEKTELRRLQKAHIENINVAKAEWEKISARLVEKNEIRLAAEQEWIKAHYHPCFDLEEVIPFLGKVSTQSKYSDVRYGYEGVEIL